MNDDMSFFKNENGLIEYNEVCSDCPNVCKQSFRADLISCSELAEEENENDQ